METLLEKNTTTPQTTKLLSGAEAVIQCLLEEKVEVLFGYPGGAIMPVYDALYDFRNQLNHVLVRHEQGAGHAAEGYARACGKPGVCLVTSGPGATNLITAITDAMMDSVPMVCLVGQVAKSLLGTDAFQEADLISMTLPITKWNYQITSADEIPEVMAKAFYIATSGRPGPVLVDITKSAQFEKMTQAFTYEKCTRIFSYQPKNTLMKVDLERAAEILNAAERPYVFAGHGVTISGAENALMQLVEKTDMPVGCTLHGLSAFPAAHPNYAGMLGMHGHYAANIMTNEADVILAIGMRFDDRVTGDLRTFAKQAKIVHIDIDASELNKNMSATVALRGDAKDALEQLLPLLHEKKRVEWNQAFKNLYREEFEKVISNQVYPTTGQLKMGEVIHQVSEMTQGKALVVADVGQHQMMTARYYQFAENKSFISSGGLGTMGFALPAAMGAQMGKTKRTVVAFIGDGCFQMTLQELGTIQQNKLPVKIIILNNHFLGMVRQWQELFFESRYSFTELQNPDFVTIAKGFGIAGENVEQREQLQTALERMFAFDGPYLLNITVEKEDNVFPMVPGGGSVHEIRLQ
jgi:acetolactate synthase-1/2/3 large subunit